MANDFFNDSDLLQPRKGSIADILQEFGNEVQEALRNNLEQDDSNESFLLWQSIDFSVELFGTQFQFKLKLEDYYDFVNKGVHGKESSYTETQGSPYRRSKMPPETPIRRWMNNKGVFVNKGTTLTSIASRKTFKAGSHDQQVFAIRRSIRDKGQRATHFYDKVITPERISRLQRDLEKASAKDVTTFIRNNAGVIFGKTALEGFGI